MARTSLRGRRRAAGRDTMAPAIAVPRECGGSFTLSVSNSSEIAPCNSVCRLSTSEIDHRDGHALAGRETRSRISNAECVIRRKPLVNGREAEVKTKFATVSNGWSLRLGNSQESTMRDLFRKTAIAATAAIAISTTTIAASTPAEAYWRGGGWGWGLAGFAIGTGLALAATAPYYGGLRQSLLLRLSSVCVWIWVSLRLPTRLLRRCRLLSGLSPGLLWLWIPRLTIPPTGTTRVLRLWQTVCPSRLPPLLVSIRQFKEGLRTPI